jgi:hypothetical protein
VLCDFQRNANTSGYLQPANSVTHMIDAYQDILAASDNTGIHLFIWFIY